jgi:hypothetical protein
LPKPGHGGALSVANSKVDELKPVLIVQHDLRGEHGLS